MFRGMTTFVCDDCGHRFKGMDIEWRASVYSQPLRCPHCGSYHTRPRFSFKYPYLRIWQELDEIKNL